MTFISECNLDLPNFSFIYRVVLKRSETEIYSDCNYLATEDTIYLAQFFLSKTYKNFIDGIGQMSRNEQPSYDKPSEKLTLNCARN